MANDRNDARTALEGYVSGNRADTGFGVAGITLDLHVTADRLCRHVAAK